MQPTGELVFLHNSLPVGGVELLRLAIARELLKRGVQFRICALECEGDIGLELRRLGIPVDVLHTRQGIWDVRVWKRLSRYLRQRRPAIIESALFESNTHARLIAHRAGVPVVVCEEHDLAEFNACRGRINRLLHRGDDQVLVVSQAVKHQMLDAGMPEKKLHLIYNCIDPSLFDTTKPGHVREELGISKNAFVIGHVGSFSQRKGHVILFRAFAKLVLQHPARLLLVGDGPLRHDLNQLAETLGIQDMVIFAGVRRDIKHCLDAMDVFAFPSVAEALGIALLEAMYAGLPIVASDNGGIPEVLTHEEDGLITKTNDVTSLYHGLLRMREDDPLRRRLAHAAHEKVKRNFLPPAYVDSLFTMYRQIFARKHISPPAWLEP